MADHNPTNSFRLNLSLCPTRLWKIISLMKLKLILKGERTFGFSIVEITGTVLVFHSDLHNYNVLGRKYNVLSSQFSTPFLTDCWVKMFSQKKLPRLLMVTTLDKYGLVGFTLVWKHYEKLSSTQVSFSIFNYSILIFN